MSKKDKTIYNKNKQTIAMKKKKKNKKLLLSALVSSRDIRICN